MLIQVVLGFLARTYYQLFCYTCPLGVVMFTINHIYIGDGLETIDKLIIEDKNSCHLGHAKKCL